MMVTFVSQCEKKALKRTRRVLDAFANRIGDNTWQTVITQEGLNAVKKLLRRTASKSTAISCHWLRSRSRSELVWVVGKKSKFNSQGFVPVNYTEKEVLIDIMNTKIDKNQLYANTSLQPLAQHLFAVGCVAEIIFSKLFHDDASLEKAVGISGFLHDIGKIDTEFQNWVKNPKSKDNDIEDGQHIEGNKFSFDKHPRHNEISLLLYVFLDNINLKKINQANKESIKHAIFWHHALPYRKEKSLKNIEDIHSLLISSFKEDESLENIFEKSLTLIEEIRELEKKYKASSASILDETYQSNFDQDIIATLHNSNLPVYKSYSDKSNELSDYSRDIRKNSINNIFRSCLITSDRLVSELSADELLEHIENKTLSNIVDSQLELDDESNLCSYISLCLSKFPNSERSTKQQEIAKKLSETSNISVLSGAAGCGKTKIALEWAMLKRAKKILWICPRVQICQGLFYELSSDQYLSEANIEINTGEYKFMNQWGNELDENQYFSGDIVITTIDQVLNTIITHTKIHTFIDFLNSHIVFDEFHEYVNMPAFNLLFAELIEAKKRREKNANTLLVSATPHYEYITNLLDIDREDIISMPSFNKASYKIIYKIIENSSLQENNSLFQPQSQNTIVISNTAITAQKSFIQNTAENSILLHSKFKRSDREKLFEEVYESFKQNGSQKFKVLRSGPIVQASLNITCSSMIIEATSAENTLQRLGRLDRFGENTNSENILTIVISNPVLEGKSKDSSSRFLSKHLKILASTKVWNETLSNFSQDKTFTLPELYQLYEEFYSDSKNIASIQQDILKSLEESVKLINKKILDPIVIRKKREKSLRRSMSKNSLRGDNRYVQMALFSIDSNLNIDFLNQYAYEIPVNEKDPIDSLTASIEQIEGYGESDKNLLAHMAKKHHNIEKNNAKKAYKDFILLNEARNPEFPIYLSYTPNDLDEVGGEKARHSEAIYYAICKKQPIGAISIKQLI